MMPGLETQFEETFGGTAGYTPKRSKRPDSFMYPEKP
jgi:hypothetical protein